MKHNPGLVSATHFQSCQKKEECHMENIQNQMQIIQKAIHDVRTLKDPDLKEFRDLLNPVVEAIGYRPLSEVHIDVIEMNNGTLFIDFSYSCAGCIDRDLIAIPESVWASEDPILEAKIEDARQKLSHAISMLNEAMLMVDRCKEIVSENEKKLQILFEKKGMDSVSENNDRRSRVFLCDDEFWLF